MLLGEGVSNTLAGAACPEWSSGRAIGAAYSGQAALDAQIGVFVQSALEISRLTVQMRDEVRDACARMGKDLGVGANELGGEDPRQACQAVRARIDQILRASGQASLQVRADPPRCTVDANLEARCHAECKVQLTPAQIEARCEPGKLAGTCQGTCQGSCDGTCAGSCNGTCSATDAQGRCAGSCDGTCRGTCQGTCHASCQGTWQAPRCEGTLRGPSADADCAAACRARADVKASCTPARIQVQASAGAAELDRLAATLRANLPTLLTAQWRLSRQIAGDVKALSKAGASLRGRLQSAGSHALACVSAAVNAAAEASVRVSVSVEASASVSGSVGAKAG